MSDVGMRRACYIVRFLLADRWDLRNVYYKLWGRVALIADAEQQTSLPEYQHFPDWWDQRARGLGPTVSIPLTSVGDDNQRCTTDDKCVKFCDKACFYSMYLCSGTQQFNASSTPVKVLNHAADKNTSASFLFTF